MFCQGTELKIDQLLLLSPLKNALGITHKVVPLVVQLCSWQPQQEPGGL